MKQQNVRTIMMLGLFFSFIASGYSQKKDPLAKCKQVAGKSGELIVCDLSLLKETITISLSDLTEELQILKLDDSDAGLVKEGWTVISDNYILVKGSREIPYKLFDRKTGKFLNNIGSFGQGPNEYRNVYDQQLDEKNNRIYLLPWQTKKILAYDLKGKALDPIPLCNEAPKGNFKVDTEKGIVTVSALPFTGAPAIVWTQTVKGELLKSVSPGHLSVRPDFSNEMWAYSDNGSYHFHVFTFEPRQDSIYRYDVVGNKLVPLFTLDFKNREKSIHGYSELPGYYLGGLSDPKPINEHMTTTQNHRSYIVDKNTLKGSFYELKNDYLGNIPTSFSFVNGYYIRNIDPGNLKDQLESVLNSTQKLTPEMRTKLKKLKDSISDNDNNYILYAKWRK